MRYCHQMTKLFATLKPISFKSHASIWSLKEAWISNPHDGVTNNPSESMNAVLRRIKQWKCVPLDSITLSLYQLCVFIIEKLKEEYTSMGSGKSRKIY